MTAHRLLAAGLAASMAAVTAPAAAAAPETDLAAALELAGSAADVVAIDLPAQAGAPRVRAATWVRASAAAATAALLDPARFAAVIPAMIRTDVEGPPEPSGARRIAWELEVPLFNLEGHLTLRALPGGGVEMALTDGDLSPGRVTFRATDVPGGRARLEVEAVADLRRSNFFIRRMMARSPYGEPAALAAAIWVALRATALRAEHAADAAAWRPTAALGPPRTWSADGRALAGARAAPLRARGAVALVERTPGERLAAVAVAREIGLPAATVAAALRDPQWWRTFPGWKKVTIIPAPRPAAGAPWIPAGAEVEDSIPFVDFEATWTGQPGGGLRWVATSGAAHGARLAWHAWPAEGAPRRTVAVLALHPRLEQTGSIPRRLIAAEPLLEHGLALALTLVDAWSTLGALDAPRGTKETKGAAK